MGVFSLMGSKAILAVCNFLLLACGFSLVTVGMLVLFDTDRIILSRLLTSGTLAELPHPLFHYVAIGIASLGLILSSTGILGCWASCMHNYYLLTLYFLVIIIMLVGECAIYILALAWPNCLGLGVDPYDLTQSLQSNYGTEGQEQFTAAFDLAQTWFNCCGVDSANEYDTSYWRLQALGPSLAIPLTCCKLSNVDSPKAYMDPIPVNTSLCQALELNRHEGFRHLEGCNDYIQQWYREHYLIFLGIGLIVVLIEFLVLLSTILLCTKIYKHKHATRDRIKNGGRSHPKTIDSLSSAYQRRSPLASYSNDTYGMTSSFRQNYKLTDRA